MFLKKVGSLAGVVLVAGMVLGASGCDVEQDKGDKAEQKEQTYAVNQPVKVGDVQWVVTGVKDRGKSLAATDGFSNPRTTEQKFVEVTYKVENLGDEQKTTVGVDLEDSKGREFKAIEDEFSYVPEKQQLGLLSNLNPNVSQTFTQIYEIPADATGLFARVGNLQAFDNEVKKVKLGI